MQLCLWRVIKLRPTLAIVNSLKSSRTVKYDSNNKLNFSERSFRRPAETESQKAAHIGDIAKERPSLAFLWRFCVMRCSAPEWHVMQSFTHSAVRRSVNTGLNLESLLFQLRVDVIPIRLPMMWCLSSTVRLYFENKSFANIGKQLSSDSGFSKIPLWVSFRQLKTTTIFNSRQQLSTNRVTEFISMTTRPTCFG